MNIWASTSSILSQGDSKNCRLPVYGHLTLGSFVRNDKNMTTGCDILYIPPPAHLPRSSFLTSSTSRRPSPLVSVSLRTSSMTSSNVKPVWALTTGSLSQLGVDGPKNMLKLTSTSDISCNVIKMCNAHREDLDRLGYQHSLIRVVTEDPCYYSFFLHILDRPMLFEEN